MIERLWVLGAPDPEMERIEALLRAAGERVAYAAIEGRRVRPAEAYQANPAHAGTHFVECAPAGGRPTGAVVIDHHNPGDPGFGVSPAEFLLGSSLGQVLAELATWREDIPALRKLPWPRRGGASCEKEGDVRFDGLADRWCMCIYSGEKGRDEEDGGPNSVLAQIPEDLVLAAAADHCLAAAYAGLCQGVDPDALMRWRAETRAAFQGRPVAELLADVEATRIALRDAPEVDFGADPACRMCGGEGYLGDTSNTLCTCVFFDVADMRRETPWPELPEAATRDGVSYVSGPLRGPDGVKYTCSGPPELIRAWLAGRVPAAGLVRLYGDPARGFCGGYVE